MKDSNGILDKIELYTKGRMSLEERLLFEKELTSDKSLQDQLDFSQAVDQLVIVGEALKLKEQMGKDLKPKSKMLPFVAVALFVVTTSAGLFFIFNKREEAQVSTPVSVIPEAIKKPEVQKVEPSEIQNSASQSVTKTVVDQEKKVSKAISQPFREPKAIIAEPSLPVHIPSSGSQETATQQKAINEPAKALIPHKDLCSGLTGEVEFSTIPSCKGQETGEVHLKPATIKGGKAPFTFRLGEKMAQNHFSNLAAGQYSFLIQDANGCSVENVKNVVIGEKRCGDKKEYVFNPEYDPSWPIPYDSERKAINIIIHEKGGKVFFQSSVSASQPTEWKGESNTGMVLGMGLYFFTIEYADGSADEGSIVVSR